MKVMRGEIWVLRQAITTHYSKLITHYFHINPHGPTGAFIRVRPEHIMKEPNGFNKFFHIKIMQLVEGCEIYLNERYIKKLGIAKYILNFNGFPGEFSWEKAKQNKPVFHATITGKRPEADFSREVGI
jgi:hypothetical protein